MPSAYIRGLLANAVGIALIAVLFAMGCLAMFGAFKAIIGGYTANATLQAGLAFMIALVGQYAPIYVRSLFSKFCQCPQCGKSALVVSANIDEWDSRSNPKGLIPGHALWWPEESCSQCHANLRTVG